jgi:hypothetical protein
VSHSITDVEVRAVKSLCQRPELDTAEQIAAGPYGGGLTVKQFAIALQALRDKLIAYEEEGGWRLLPDARKELCDSEAPDKPRKQERRETMLPETPEASAESNPLDGGRLTIPVR